MIRRCNEERKKPSIKVNFLVKMVNEKYFLIILSLIIYSTLCLYFLYINNFRYLIHSDGISYIEIAKRYLNGDFFNAINGQWSPLTSWLTVPFLALGIDPFLSIHFLSIIIGFFIIIFTKLMFDNLNIDNILQFPLLISFTFVICLFTLTEGVPDTLCLSVLIFYVFYLTQDKFKEKKISGLIIGIIGGIAYLAKSYNFYFFILHFSVFSFLFIFNAKDRAEKKSLLIKWTTGIFVFGLISAVWIGLLTNKYDEFMVTSATDYNFSFIRPGSTGHMALTDGLMAPHNETAFSIWEDPTYMEKTLWSPFQSKTDFKYLISNTISNIYEYLLNISRNPVFVFAIIFTIAYLIKFKYDALKMKPFYLILTIVLHPLGYFLLFVETRYIYIIHLLLYILSGYAIAVIFKNFKIIKPQKIFIISCLCIYILSYQFLSLLEWQKKQVNPKKIVYDISCEIKNIIDLENKKIASKSLEIHHDIYLAYYLGAKYYGYVKNNISCDKIKEELIKYDIDYFIVHGELDEQIDILTEELELENMTIYKVEKTI